MRKFLAAFVLFAAAALAQPPRGMFAWWDSPIARDINLSQDQMRQIRQSVKEYRVRLLETRAAVERAELDLEQIFNAETIDQQKANETVERLVSARSDLTRTISQMGLKLRAVLTPEQWQQLQQRRSQYENRPNRRRQADPATKQN